VLSWFFLFIGWCSERLRGTIRSMQFVIAFLIVAAGGGVFDVSAEERVSEEAIRGAVKKAIPLLEAGAKGSMEKRKQCFTCHNQGLPVMALVTSRGRGFEIDETNLERQIEFTAKFLEGNRTNYLAGKGQGGAALTAGYALWTLENGGWKADDTTAAVSEYLLLRQNDLDHWKPQTVRPPTEESEFTVSYVALRGLKTFGTAEQKERIAQRVERVRAWILKTPARDTEDRVFRLRALQVADAPSGEISSAVKELTAAQREDGGWPQLEKMESDAYATASALAALHQADGMATTDTAYQRGLRWLLGHQLADGSWHVRTRSEPIQNYYESGFPHGDDQFISITATGWAATALALALPKEGRTR
jgi:hypothetical protein